MDAAALSGPADPLVGAFTTVVCLLSLPAEQPNAFQSACNVYVPSARLFFFSRFKAKKNIAKA